MSIADDATGVTRFNQARGKLEKWCEKLKDDFRLLLIAFAERAEPLDGPQDLPALTPDGQGHLALPGAGGRRRSSFAPAEVAAVDPALRRHPQLGRQSAGSRRASWAWSCIRVGVGASLRSNLSYRDVQVTGIDCPDRLMLNNMARITGSIDAIGLGGRVVQVVLDEDGQQIAEAELTLDDVEGSQQVDVRVSPHRQGPPHLHGPRPAGRRREDRREQPAVGRGDGRRAGHPRAVRRGHAAGGVRRAGRSLPGQGPRPGVLRPGADAAQRVPQADEHDRPEAGRHSHRRRRRSTSSTCSSSATSTAPIFGPQQQEMFVKRVRDGAGLVMLGGYHSLGPGGYAGTPLGEVLPVRARRPRDRPGHRAVPAGAHARRRAASDLRQHRRLLPHAARPSRRSPGCRRWTAARASSGRGPAPRCWPSHPAEPAPMPVLAVQPVDKGRTAVFAGDTTRKWQQGPRALDQESPFLRFWGQMVRWLAGRGDSGRGPGRHRRQHRQGLLRAGRADPHLGRRPRQGGRGRQRRQGRGHGSRARPAGPNRSTLSTVAGPGGHYGGAFEPQAAGALRDRGRGPARRAEPDSRTRFRVEVGRPNLEFEKLDLDEKMLGRIAADTGGRYVHITTADHLIDQLDRTPAQEDACTSSGRSTGRRGFWALFVARADDGVGPAEEDINCDRSMPCKPVSISSNRRPWPG